MKRSRFPRGLLLAAALPLVAGCLTADPVTLVLSPTGGLSGPPGAIVGWGFSIQNNTPDFLEFSSSQFCVNPVLLTPLVCNAPSTGVFGDIIVGNDPIIPPNTTTPVENFDPVGFTAGLGFFQIDPAAVIGDSDIGDIVLTYDAFTADPNTCGSCQVLFSVPLAAEASVNVTSALATPEPALLGLISIAMAMVSIMVARRRVLRAQPRSI